MTDRKPPFFLSIERHYRLIIAFFSPAVKPFSHIMRSAIVFVREKRPNLHNFERFLLWIIQKDKLYCYKEEIHLKKDATEKEEYKMKKLLALFLACTMALGLVACNGKEEETPTPSAKEAVASMEAPIDALARCMLENDMEYEPENPDFFWTALYYFAGAYGLEHELVEEVPKTYQLKVPKTVMEEHAIALFSTYDGLMDLPSIMKGNVSYDPDEDAYFLSRGDIGASEMRLTNVEETEDGYSLVAELWSRAETEELIAAWDVTLIRNTFSEGIKNPLYLCSVSSMKQIKEDAPDENGSSTITPDETITAVFNGLSDSHTAEVTLPDGSIQAFQFDSESAAGKIINSLNEGDGFTFGYTTDNATGANIIVSVK